MLPRATVHHPRRSAGDSEDRAGAEMASYCPGRVDVVAADHRRGWLEAVSTTLHEWGGLIEALTFARGC